MPPPFQTLDVAGISTEFLVLGTGAPILFLHGGDGLEADLPFIEALADKAKVVAPSHPGFGGSALPRHFNGVDDIAYHTLDLLEALDLSDVTVVGCSFGGWIAAELAIKANPRLSRLVLIDALGFKFGPPDQREILDLFSLTPNEAVAAAYCGAPPPSAKPKTMEEAVRIARNREAFSIYGWSPTLHDPKLVRRLHRIRIETLILWGAEDRVVSADYGRTLAARLPNARFKTIAAAGHFPHLEQTAATLGEIHEFLGVGHNALGRRA